MTTAVSDPFRKQNESRLDMLKKTVTTLKWKVFNAIPILIHYPLAGLPGSEPAGAPAGLAPARFRATAREAARELFPELRGYSAPARRADFLSLFAMGSVGTSCFTSESDIDFWLIYRPGKLDSYARHIALERLKNIEEWAERKAGLEIHFYLHDLEEIQKATFSYDKENAGTFGPILKEEFLRTAVYVAGAEPSFWPSASEPTTDFGPLQKLTSEQYLAACLQQLEKAIDKPFKSAIKVALLRNLAANPERPTPAEIVRDRIREGKRVDPYILLVEYLWEYFRSTGQEKDFRFLKTVLYLKIVSEETSQGRLIRTQEHLLKAGFQGIGPSIDLAHLSRFFSWPFSERRKFAEEITAYIHRSIREISMFHRSDSSTADWLRLLTKKFGLRRFTQDTIESLTFSDVPSRGEKNLSFILHPETGTWHLSLQLFVGRPDPERIHSIFHSPSPIVLLAFALKNNLWRDRTTEIRAYPSDEFPKRHGIFLRELSRLFDHHFPLENLDRKEKPIFHLLAGEMRHGVRETFKRITLFTVTSWGLVRYKIFTGPDSLSTTVREIIGGVPAREGVRVVTDSPSKGLESEIERIFRRASADPDHAFLAGDSSHLLVIDPPDVFVASSFRELVRNLSSRPKPTLFTPNPQGEDETFLKTIFTPERDEIRVYRWTEKNETLLIIMDPAGRLYSWSRNRTDADFSLPEDLRYVAEFSEGVSLQCFEIEHRPGFPIPWAVSTVHVPNRRTPNPEREIHVFLEAAGILRASIGHRTLGPASPEEVYRRIAEVVREARRGRKSYPVHITSLRFPAYIHQRVSPVDALRKKHEMEDRITRLLENL
ncbi:MAG: hypothetical protein D6679_11600 [Candidatus Hydrogenedentota bacterium]|nr:MAG: hypothetical protein D6679_11600 [Candidatus Hydrogenedentota bacterium]